MFLPNLNIGLRDPKFFQVFSGENKKKNISAIEPFLPYQQNKYRFSIIQTPYAIIGNSL